MLNFLIKKLQIYLIHILKYKTIRHWKEHYIYLTIWKIQRKLESIYNKPSKIENLLYILVKFNGLEEKYILFYNSRRTLLKIRIQYNFFISMTDVLQKRKQLKMIILIKGQETGNCILVDSQAVNKEYWYIWIILYCVPTNLINVTNSVNLLVINCKDGFLMWQ